MLFKDILALYCAIAIYKSEKYSKNNIRRLIKHEREILERLVKIINLNTLRPTERHIEGQIKPSININIVGHITLSRVYLYLILQQV